MNLPEFLTRRKPLGRLVYTSAVICLVGVGAFFLGRLSADISSQGGLRIVGEDTGASASLAERNASTPHSSTEVGEGAIAGGVVASKAGSKYHFPWCAGAQAIKESNKIWFESTEEARKEGYTKASNCKGLE